MRKIRVVLSVLFASLSLAAFGFTSPAMASVHNESDLSGNQYALNNWSGGGYIRMGTQGAPNSSVGFFAVPRCRDNSGNPTSAVQATVVGDNSNCPFSTQSLDAQYAEAGAYVVAIDVPNGSTSGCININGSNDAVVGTCPNFSDGTGGGNGSIFVRYTTGSGCGNPNESEFVSRPQSDAAGGSKFLHDPNVYAGYPSFGSFTCWVSADH